MQYHSLVNHNGVIWKMRKSNKKIHAHERSISSYDRKPGKHPPRKNILIVCEGKETEPNYFKSLRCYLKLQNVQVEIKDRAGAPKSIIDMAVRLQEKRKKESEKSISLSEYDTVWCVFDIENPHLNPSLKKAISKADSNNYELAISNPAFEFWYILHFGKTTRPFNNGKEVKDLLKTYINNYSESLDVFSLLRKKTKYAINNSKEILDKHPEKEERFPNPSTRIHLLVKEMIEMSIIGREEVN